MKRRILLPLFAFSLLTPWASQAQTRRAEVNPLLEPVLAQPTARIPDSLRGTSGGFQGRRSLAGRGEALSLILRTTATRSDLERMGIEVRSLRAGIATVTVAPADLEALAARGDVSQIILPQVARPLLAKSTPDTGVKYLRSQTNGVFTGKTGKNVVVGVIDSGVSLDHANLQNPNGTTRLLYVWDQTQNPNGAGIKPAGYTYGTEWTAADIDGGIATEHDEVSASGHGTHTTGIAAGNGASPDETGAVYNSVGMAPESRIIVVKTTFAFDDIIDGMEYIFAKADALGLPCVINLSLGTDLGSHTGDSPLEESIDALVTAKAGRAVVVAAGNSRDGKIHAETATAQGAVKVVPFTIPTYAASAGYEDRVVIAGYYAASDTLGLQLIAPDGVTSVSRTLGNGTNCMANYQVTSQGSILICHGKKSALGENTSDREIVIIITDQNGGSAAPKKGTWQIKLTGTTVTSTGGADFWLQSELSDNISANAASFADSVADEYETLGIPGTSREAITVGAYATRLCWTDSNGNSYGYFTDFGIDQDLGDLAYFSGVGPTRDNRFKPDLVAPGMAIFSALAPEVKSGLLNGGQGFSVINDYYLFQQGTSQAAPHVTGAVALLFEQEPNLTNAQVKSKLANAARKDAFVNAKAGLFGLNAHYGAGKLDLGPWAYSDPNETNDTASQATLALSGQVFAGYMDRANDVDLYNLQGVKTGDTLAVSLTNLPQDYALALQASSASIISQCSTPSLTNAASSNNGSTFPESITHTVGAGPITTIGIPHFLRVTSSAGFFDIFLPYQLKAIITRPEQSAAHGTAATAQALPNFKTIKVAGQTATSSEKDIYSLTINALATLTVQGPVGPTLEILDKNGLSVATSTNGTVSWQAQGALFTSQTLYAVIRGQAVSYTLTLTKP